MRSPEGESVRTAPRKIGESLVARGRITEAQLEEALEAQKTDGRSIGKILVSMGYLTTEELARALSERLNVDYVALFDMEVDPEVRGVISEDVLAQHNAVPLKIDNGRLIVAMSDPNDLYARSDLTVSAGRPITPVVAAEDAVSALRHNLFGGQEAPGAPVIEAGPVEERLSEDAAEQEERGDARVPGRPAKAAKLGEILIAEGKITQEQLEQALSVQEHDPRDLGKILVSLGLLSGADLAQALAVRLKLDYVVLSELSEEEVDDAALNLIDEDTLRKYMALPLRFEDGRLIVAMSDPNDLFALEDLRIAAKHPITPVVASEEDLRGAYATMFGGDDRLYPVANEETGSDGGGSAEPEAPPTEDETEPAAVADADPSGESSRDGAGGNSSPGMELEEVSKKGRVGVKGGKIGELLVAERKITQEQLDQALDLQKNDRRQIGKILLSLGYINGTDLAQALARRLRLDYAELTESDVDRGVASLVDQKVLRKHGVLPLRLENGRLVVAMSDPTNIYALEDLMMISGYPITPVVALEEEIQSIHNKIFAIGEDVTGILEEAGKESVTDDHGEIHLGETLPEEAPVVRLVGSILQQAVGDGASDIHIEPRARELTVRMRVDGVLREVMSIPPKLQSGVIARLKIVGNLDIAERRVPQDGRFSVRLGGQRIDLRVASLPTVFGEKVVLRLLDTSNAQVELPELGFPPKVYERYEEIFRRPYGAILVTGPTGSGKSTTLYATLNELNSPEKNIITVEDPVEYRMRGINQMQTNPRAGLTFASALRSILRADPDIVMIGEIRDAETAQIAVEAALTGHLVLSTLHTNSAPGALSRLTDMGIEPFLTSSAVDCVIAQRLARRLCENCKEPVELEEEILAGMQFPFEHVDNGDLRFHRAVGCNRCVGMGYRGRFGIYELMAVTESIRDLILRRASADEIGRVAREEGMVRLRDEGLLKAAQGITTIEEVLRSVV